MAKADDKKRSKKVQSVSNVNLLLAEFLGTTLLLFLGCMGCITEYETMPIPHYFGSINFGLVVMIIIQMFGHISGAHLNPAVTMATLIFRIIKLKSVPFYLLGQFAGGIFGIGLLKLLVPKEYSEREYFDQHSNETKIRAGLCVTTVTPKMDQYQAVIIEAVITFVLIFVCCAIWDKRNKANTDSIPLRFGFVIASISMTAGPFTGASMNTARSFGPALLSGDWTDQWIYWVGPTVGGLIASYLYKFIYTIDDEETHEDEIEKQYEIPLTLSGTHEKI